MPRLTIAVLMLAGPLTCLAQSGPPFPGTGETAPHPLAGTPDDFDTEYGRTAPEEHPLLPPAPFRTTELAVEPTDGGWTPGRPYPHYPAPSEVYGIWYRPSSFGRKCPERCTEPVWKPRGYGNLFARSSACERMDYQPFELHDYRTEEGPAYLALPPDYACGYSTPRYPGKCCNTDICTNGNCRGDCYGSSDGGPRKRSWLGRLLHLQAPWGGSGCD